jgi:hypothetical protein
MPMDIFKLIYQHDIRLDQLRERHTDRSVQQTSGSIEDFMKPDPTYSKFYFTGTRPEEQEFGFNVLNKTEAVLGALSEALKEYRLFTLEGESDLRSAIYGQPVGAAMVLSEHTSISWNLQELSVDDDSNVGHKKGAVAHLLETDDLLLYKEQAHNGFDLHLFSKQNIYRNFFYPLQELVDDEFRFFSMNGKRINSERTFYFETWALDRPPHGIEEVFTETVL